MADVQPGLSQEIQRLVQATVMVRKLVDRRMVLQVLAIFDGSLLDFIDRLIDPTDRFDLILGLYPVAGTMLDHPPRSAEIRKRMQIIRMFTKAIYGAGGIGPRRSTKPDEKYCTYIKETLDLHLHFHERE